MDTICTPPDIMVCYRVKTEGSNQPTSYNNNGFAGGQNNAQTMNAMTYDPVQAGADRRIGTDGLPLKQSKSRELRASIMYTGCDCEKRNGLQDDCQRSECRGSPQCLTQPNPTCGPSQFSNGKHLELKRLYMEEVMRARRHNIGTDAKHNADQGKDPNNAYQNPYAQGRNPAGIHPDDCCCCCCCNDATYYCVEGVLDTRQNPFAQTQVLAKCPGAAQCGPGICPVGKCQGGVCDIGTNNQVPNYIENIMQGGAKCPGTAQCGPGICPAGKCQGGVCDTGMRGDQGVGGNKNCCCQGRGRVR